ncbi:MAG: hypothetical protein K2G63_06535, partial [Oscillospiraceae bacterium]|nr:hypothetical protein [Oscillospiraceae bacterium]
MNITPEQLLTAFTVKYSPYLLKDYSFPERKPEDIPVDEKHPELCSLVRNVDLKRKEDPFIGAKLAGQEIYLNLTNWLKNEKGVHAETLLAVLGSVGGHECVKGIMNTLNSIVNDNSPDKNMEKAVAGLLGILIVETTNRERYIMGDRIGNAFSSFYETAASENGIALDKLTTLASEVASKIGTENYWITSFGEFVKENPRELADLFDGKFERTFNIYCCFPYERMLGFAVATQKAVKQAESVISKETALSILAEFGWRTA